MSIGVPVKLLHEAQGHVLTVELKTGELYRGKLDEAEDNFNCLMSDVTVTGRDGKVGRMEHVYLRGSKIRYLILPDMLKNAPFFKRIKGNQAVGRGKTAILRAQAAAKGRGRGKPAAK
eukprot:comp11861_c0_seq1/m.6492 comp11861_c0_seq1/g.6492  ORF comp11861_c0_seq1/g.6492 comp11861_c0_seq1/m.6492 type:complete len:118 (-) comp11861_c0_seq1:147-500(-)